MKRWIEKWNAFWFPTTSTLPLSICRIVAVACQLLWFMPPLQEQLNLLERNRDFIDPQLLIQALTAVIPREVIFTPSAFPVFYRAIVVVGVVALLGFFTRTSLFLFALGNWILVAHRYSYSDLHHPEAVFSIFLMALAFAPSGDRLSIDALIRRLRGRATKVPARVDTAMWPLKLGQVLLALAYFSTGASKVLSGGLSWMNGYTLQYYVFADALNRKIPLGIWVAQHHALSILLSVYTVLFELCFVLSIFFPRTAPFFLANAFLFQLGLHVTAGHGFFQHMVLALLLLVFLYPDWWRAGLKKYFNVDASRWLEPAQATGS